jgi:hypothetical protein
VVDVSVSVIFLKRTPGYNSREVYVEFVVGKIALGHCFLRILGFPLTIVIPANLHFAHPKLQRLSLTAPQETKKENFYFSNYRLKTLSFSLMAAGPPYITSGRTAQRTPLPTAFILLHECLLYPLPGNCRCLESHRLATPNV